MSEIKNRLEPVLAKLRNPSKRISKMVISQKQGRSYLEMKLNLTLSYCTFLTYYLLLKVEGQSNTVSHPVTYKLTHIKTLFEKLKPLDEKMTRQIDLVLSLDEDQEEDDQSLDEEMEEEPQEPSMVSE
jgi:hypothetical protein